ncbi:MAG: NAD(P)-dependent oxidoreductase [Prevotellaceae bacterium]|jgi:nucleoside-diphosphate-sugar epimerase|nr:NAD(P)-dependent oxidoreductase [Prevotellaceae bacterium]
MSKILITGGTGCIGSVTIFKLLKYPETEKITVATRSGNVEPVKLWLGESIDPRVEFVTLDVSDYGRVEELVPAISPTHIIHLGGFQSPDCSAYHHKGMEINVGGTMTLLDVAAQLPHLKRFVFASSGAVYGRRDEYPEAVIKEEVRLAPPNHYGIWKLAGEHLARLFHSNTGIPTVCLRLNTTYGPGRDKGMTSAPTSAIKSIVQGYVEGRIIPFEMPYKGRENYHYVEDVGEHFAAAALDGFAGYGEFNIKGRTIEVSEFLDIIRKQAKEAGMEKSVDISIANDANPNMFSHDLCHNKIENAFPNCPLTDIEQGVKKSLMKFYEIAKRGKLT